jgi:hypothetical protein
VGVGSLASCCGWEEIFEGRPHRPAERQAVRPRDEAQGLRSGRPLSRFAQFPAKTPATAAGPLPLENRAFARRVLGCGTVAFEPDATSNGDFAMNSQTLRPEIFWGEIAPCEHVVQIYQDESVFMAVLEGFIDAGLRAGEAAVVIATAAHLSSLESRLLAAGHDLVAARCTGLYTALDAAGTLSRFMVDGWPDEERFAAVIHEVLGPARQGGRKVRAFGEMVALLWAQGHHGATVRLEHLWGDFCNGNALALFCAYPRIGATRDLTESLAEVCALHSRVIAA